MRLTEKDLEKEVAGEDYYQFPETTVTVCCLKLHNGMCLIGESACIDKCYFDPEVGKKVARENALDQLWKLLAFRQLDKNPRK